MVVDWNRGTKAFEKPLPARSPYLEAERDGPVYTFLRLLGEYDVARGQEDEGRIQQIYGHLKQIAERYGTKIFDSLEKSADNLNDPDDPNLKSLNRLVDLIG